MAEIFTEVWADIPEIDRSAILARGYGRVDVDVLEKGAIRGPADRGGDIPLDRAAVDTYPRNVVLHLVARDLARKVDDFISKPKSVTRRKKPDRDTRRRIITILERWGYLARVEPEYTPADEDAHSRQFAPIRRPPSRKKIYSQSSPFSGAASSSSFSNNSRSSSQ